MWSSKLQLPSLGEPLSPSVTSASAAGMPTHRRGVSMPPNLEEDDQNGLPPIRYDDFVGRPRLGHRSRGTLNSYGNASDWTGSTGPDDDKRGEMDPIMIAEPPPTHRRGGSIPMASSLSGLDLYGTDGLFSSSGMAGSASNIASASSSTLPKHRRSVTFQGTTSSQTKNDLFDLDLHSLKQTLDEVVKPTIATPPRTVTPPPSQNSIQQQQQSAHVSHAAKPIAMPPTSSPSSMAGIPNHLLMVQPPPLNTGPYPHFHGAPQQQSQMAFHSPDMSAFGHLPPQSLGDFDRHMQAGGMDPNMQLQLQMQQALIVQQQQWLMAMQMQQRMRGGPGPSGAGAGAGGGMPAGNPPGGFYTNGPPSPPLMSGGYYASGPPSPPPLNVGHSSSPMTRAYRGGGGGGGGGKGGGGGQHHNHHHGPNPQNQAMSSSGNIGGATSSNDAVLSEYKATGMRPRIEDLKGHVTAFATDAHGSRFLQYQMEIAKPEDKDMLVSEAVPSAVMLMQDTFGNYVIQNFLEHATVHSRRALAETLKGSMLALSLQPHGCRVVQRALDLVEVPQRNQLLEELLVPPGNVSQAAKNTHATHVLQKTVSILRRDSALEMQGNDSVAGSVDLMRAMEKAIADDVVNLLLHPHSYRLVLNVLSDCDPTRSVHVKRAIEVVNANRDQLCVDQHGNFMLQHMLDNTQADSVLDYVQERVVELSQHKFGSHLVEKCFTVASSERCARLVEEIIRPTSERNISATKKLRAQQMDGSSSTNDSEWGRPDSPALALMKDPYANFVVQKAYDRVQPSPLKTELTSLVQDNAELLSKFTYGRHILSHVNAAKQSAMGQQPNSPGTPPGSSSPTRTGTNSPSQSGKGTGGRNGGRYQHRN